MSALSDQLPVIAEAFRCGVVDWNAFRGDPLISGTTFVLAYGLTGWLILKAARACAGRERWLWMLSAIFFFFQAANTNLDLHGLIFTVGRCLAHAQGWYEDRRAVQFAVLLGLALGAMLILLIAVRVFRRNLANNVLLIAGTGTALGLTLVKGVNLHGLEALYDGVYGPFRGADLVELSGIAIALLAARLRLAHQRRQRGAMP